MELSEIGSDQAASGDAMREAWLRTRDLALKFKASEVHYMSGSYQEAEVRKDFIDKLFSALGWDVDHVVEHDPYRQEVKIEKPSRKQSGRADYAFSLAPMFQRVRFFVEAKRPQPNIVAPDNCFQIIRYSWPLGLPIGVLTDFRSIHVVDTRHRPNIATAAARVVRSWTLADLLDEEGFAGLYWLLSREAVVDGSIGRFSDAFLPDAVAAQRQYRLFAEDTRDFDEDFLAKMGEWRDQLATAFAAADGSLTGGQITEAVQRTLDRLIFTRFLEDKQIEPDPIVRSFGTGGIGAWRGFVRESRRLDSIYNGIVFKRHPVVDAAGFQPMDGPFADICDELSDQHSPYNFAAIPIEILGRIYEQFLGSSVVRDADGVRIERKGAVRKAGGVYYTPQYVVNYMVDQTIGPALAGKGMDAVLAYTAIDTSCGSGSFLIGVFDRLMRAALAVLPEAGARDRERYLVERDGERRLSMDAKREILQRCVYGVDIDAQAVEVAQVSLYLKLLSDETTYSAKHQQLEMGAALLPSLAANILEGNSLVTLSGEMFTPATMNQVKSLDFHASFSKVFEKGGFDLVIGNPPYIKEPTNRDAFDYARASPYYQGKMDIWYMFGCRALDWLKTNGRLALIATSNWVTNAGASILRGKIAAEARIEQLIDFGDFKVFTDADIQTMILIARKVATPAKYTFDLRRLGGPRASLADAQALLSRREGPALSYLEPTFDRRTRAEGSFTFSTPEVEGLLQRIAGRRNFELNGGREVAQGIVPNPDIVSAGAIEHIPDIEQRERGVAIGDGVFVVDAERFPEPDVLEQRFLKPCFEPSDVDRYAVRRESRLRLIYSKRELTAHTPLPKRLYDHLQRYKEIMERRRETKSGQMEAHHLHWPRDERFFQEGPKILAVRKGAVPVFAYVEQEAYVMMAFNVIRTDRAQMLFLTGLLNSSVIRFWLRHRGKMQGANYQIDKEPLLALPLRVPDEATQTRISGLVRHVIDCTNFQRQTVTAAEKARAERTMREAEHRVDEAIYNVYLLASEDRDIIDRNL